MELKVRAPKTPTATVLYSTIEDRATDNRADQISHCAADIAQMSSMLERDERITDMLNCIREIDAEVKIARRAVSILQRYNII